jgi:ferritin-like metal-binding protein YciE
MANAHDNYMDWLRDAHAMEEQAERMLNSTASRIENYPEVRAQLESHARISRQQADALRACIERRGGDTSTLKDLAGKLTATAQGMSGLFVSAEVVKATMSTYTFAHMAIASYHSLAAAAQALGDIDTAQVAQAHLAQEEALAAAMLQALPSVTQQFLVRANTPNVTAKH